MLKVVKLFSKPYLKSIECLLTLSQFDFVCTSSLIILSIYTTHKIR
ncbi:hypothetical protein H1P_1960004 [Hyella patelloides LEGE 07179]|uniref:Uncharacterized protein n=1 Tax=Hyella patelloides LEGE 07179 TaxID=945734 RepID=A0A563VPG2_9CYAN|nr:hypothetical protein H1P_1960004 [Hyella patelloides LEGE 07179]